MKAIGIFLFVLLSSALSYGQHKKKNAITIGQTMDSLYLSSVPRVSIFDVKDGIQLTSDDNGIFTLHIEKGDTLSYWAGGYDTSTYVYQGAAFAGDTLRLWLQPKADKNLETVYIKYTYHDYQRDSLERYRDFVELTGNKKSTFANGNSGVGVGLSLDNLFSKKEKQRKAAYDLFNQLEEQRYVDFRFNHTIVHHFSGLMGTKLHDFMTQYRPTYQWLRDNPTREDLQYYILDKLNHFYRTTENNKASN